MRGIWLALLLLAAPLAARAAEDPQAEFERAWSALLAAHTRSVPGTVGTVVDYRTLGRGETAAAWKQLLADLAALPLPEGAGEGQRDAKLALWINAYNVLAIDTVLRNYPVESIRDVGAFWNPVWNHEAGVVGGRTVSLGEIEHEILRPMGDARIHAAIVCASTSCPSLRRSAFTRDGLDAELDEAMGTWLASATKGVKVDRAGATVTVSRIFDWFEEDWEPLGGPVGVAARWGPESERAWLAANRERVRVRFFDYDWRLNDAR